MQSGKINIQARQLSVTLQRCVLCLPGQRPTCGGLISTTTITPLTAALHRITHHTLHVTRGDEALSVAVPRLPRPLGSAAS